MFQTLFLCIMMVMEIERDFDQQTMTMATAEDVLKMWHKLWGKVTVLYILGRFEVEGGEYLDLMQTGAQAMTYVTAKTKMSEREYLQHLSDMGYTVIPPNLMTIDDVLYLYKQIDKLKAELANANEGARLLHSLATGGEPSVLSRLDNGVDAQDAERWRDAPEYKEAQQVADKFNFETVTEQEF